jgi:hypothetical protein
MRSDSAQDDMGERPFQVSAILVMPGDFGNLRNAGNFGNAFRQLQFICNH